jgi:8-oxo-dGTP diphosphatase
MHVVDTQVIIRYKGGIVLVKETQMWALPGGLLEDGETLEQAAVRVTREETNLEVRNLQQLHTYSGERYPGCKEVTAVFIAEGKGNLRAGDSLAVFDVDELPDLAYDHKKILLDYQNGEYLGLD